MFDYKLLISLVHEREELWNNKCKLYKNKVIRKKLWDEISTKMQFPCEIIQCKWRSMRDRYTKIHKLNHLSGSNSNGCKSRWIFYDLLFFLKDMKNVSPMVCKLNQNSSELQNLEKPNTVTTNIQKNEDKDESFHYLMSFLPYLQEVPKHRRLSVRCKLQKVFSDEQEKNYN